MSTPVIKRFVLDQTKGLTQFTRDVAQESTLTFWKLLGELSKVESKDIVTFATKNGMALREGQELTFFNKLRETVNFMFSKFKALHRTEQNATKETFKQLTDDMINGVFKEPSKRGIKAIKKLLEQPGRVEQYLKNMGNRTTLSPNSNVRNLLNLTGNFSTKGQKIFKKSADIMENNLKPLYEAYETAYTNILKEKSSSTIKAFKEAKEAINNATNKTFSLDIRKMINSGVRHSESLKKLKNPGKIKGERISKQTNERVNALMTSGMVENLRRIAKDGKLGDLLKKVTDEAT